MSKIVLIVSLCILMVGCGSGKLFETWQTSASLLMKHSKQAVSEAGAKEKPEALKKNLLMTDIYIKARSYAILDKAFFSLHHFRHCGIPLAILKYRV